MLSFWGFLICRSQFVSFTISLKQYILNISILQTISKISRRRLWSLRRFYRDCSRLLSRLRHMRLSQGTLRRDLHGCSSFVILYHHTFLILRGCHSPCHFSWWRRRHLRKGSSKNRKWQKWLWQKWLMTTIQNKQAHPLWSEPDWIRFSCHVSPELLVTSAVKSPLVRRKVRPWAMAASNWGSWARVANGNNDIMTSAA